MPRRQVRFAVADADALRAGLSDIVRELRLPRGFPSDVLKEAEDSARCPALPSHDATDIPLVTIDPLGSRDLDQALFIERHRRGFRLHYAIADVAAFVRPGGVVDREAQQRGETLYSPDSRTPLYPRTLSEDAASLLPGEDRPALLWSFDLDEYAEPVTVDVRRTIVRSRKQYDYATAQQILDAGTAPEPLPLLREFGLLREQRERERGAVHLPIPEQEVVETRDGYRLAFRAPLPVEGWNAHVSLLTGMVAAELMLYGEVGVLRTLPPAPPEEVAKLRRTARALDVPWPDGAMWQDVLRRLDPNHPADAALLDEATALFRGAGYTTFDGGVPELVTHAGVASEYAHVTAPLRRLVDRFALEICVAMCAGDGVPDWARIALPYLPDRMQAAGRRAGALERATLDLVEAVLLHDRIGEQFSAVVVDVHAKGGGEVQLNEPAVRARCDGADLPLGRPLRVRCVEADPLTRQVRFEPA